ncbi:MAG: ATP-dependent protease ATPase subunit HslU [Thermoguttaceae bacterium]|nr:ATP-dependent protease ATPase subunit HslU [Thermoguttaceae bacterium]
MIELTPRQIVEELDKYIVGQDDAKRAIAIAIRNRWRRQRVADDMRDEIGPKNMMMVGPTGVGKTEIARRLAALTGAPFIKVDATKYTEVGYYGRDVESMARELVENAIGLVRAEEREKNAEKAREAAEKRLVDLLVEKFEREERRAQAVVPAENPTSESGETSTPETEAFQDLSYWRGELLKMATSSDPEEARKFRKLICETPLDFSEPEKSVRKIVQKFEEKFGKPPRTAQKDATPRAESSARADRDEIEVNLRLGTYENEIVSIVEERRQPVVSFGALGADGMANDIQQMLDGLGRKRSSRREIPVSEARKILIEQEAERLLDKDAINEKAIELAENLGIIFIDEIDKIVGGEGGRGADVSRQGVQRDLLPIVEGTTIQTRYGLMSTEHVLFIAAGAFHRVSPSDLTPELQGRFPIRVELAELKKEDFVRILTEPKTALTKQYAALMKTENIDLIFESDAIDALAELAAEANLTNQNIGARRLCTIMELLLEDLNFEAPEMGMGRVVVNAAYVREKIENIVRNEDLSKFVL